MTRATQRKARRRRLPTVALVGYTSGQVHLAQPADMQACRRSRCSRPGPTTSGSASRRRDGVAVRHCRVRPRLPHQLVGVPVDVEEVVDADLLLHVVAQRTRRRRAHRRSNRAPQIDGRVPCNRVNKADLADVETIKDQLNARWLRCISGDGRGHLRITTTIGDRLRRRGAIIECFVPYDRRRARGVAPFRRGVGRGPRRRRDPGARAPSGPSRGAFRRVHTMMLV